MTVRELRAVLEQIPQDAIVTSTDDGTRDDKVYVVVAANGTAVDISLFAGVTGDITRVRDGRFEWIPGHG